MFIKISEQKTTAFPLTHSLYSLRFSAAFSSHCASTFSSTFVHSHFWVGVSKLHGFIHTKSMGWGDFSHSLPFFTFPRARVTVHALVGNFVVKLLCFRTIFEVLKFTQTNIFFLIENCFYSKNIHTLPLLLYISS